MKNETSQPPSETSTSGLSDSVAIRTVLIAVAALPGMALAWSLASHNVRILALYWTSILVTAYFVHHAVRRSELRIRAARRRGEQPASSMGSIGYLLLLGLFGALIWYAWDTRDVLPVALALAAVTGCFAAIFQNLPGSWSPEALDQMDGAEGAEFARTHRAATGQPWSDALPSAEGWYDVLDEDESQGLMQVADLEDTLHARSPDDKNWFPLSTWGGYRWRGPITSADFVPPTSADLGAAESDADGTEQDPTAEQE